MNALSVFYDSEISLIVATSCKLIHNRTQARPPPNWCNIPYNLTTNSEWVLNIAFFRWSLMVQKSLRLAAQLVAKISALTVFSIVLRRQAHFHAPSRVVLPKPTIDPPSLNCGKKSHHDANTISCAV
jgi:hypothetical protein